MRQALTDGEMAGARRHSHEYRSSLWRTVQPAGGHGEQLAAGSMASRLDLSRAFAERPGAAQALLQLPVATRPRTQSKARSMEFGAPSARLLSLSVEEERRSRVCERVFETMDVLAGAKTRGLTLQESEHRRLIDPVLLRAPP